MVDKKKVRTQTRTVEELSTTTGFCLLPRRLSRLHSVICDVVNPWFENPLFANPNIQILNTTGNAFGPSATIFSFIYRYIYILRSLPQHKLKYHTMLSTLSVFRTSPAAKPSTIALAWRTLSSAAAAGGTNYDVVVIGPCAVVVVAPACVKSDDDYFIFHRFTHVLFPSFFVASLLLLLLACYIYIYI